MRIFMHSYPPCRCTIAAFDKAQNKQNAKLEMHSIPLNILKKLFVEEHMKKRAFLSFFLALHKIIFHKQEQRIK